MTAISERTNFLIPIDNCLEECGICCNTIAHRRFVGHVIDETNHVAHIFHRSCLSQWLQANQTCPICRTNFDNAYQYTNLTRPQAHQHLPADVRAARNGDLVSMRALLRRNIPMSQENRGRAITAALRNGDAEMFQLIVSQRR